MTEKIVITGATGVIGRRAIGEFLAAGHEVTGITRSPRGRAIVGALGAQAVDADVFDEAALRRAFDGASIVVNLLTHIPPAERMADPAAWEENTRLRTEASTAVARAAEAAGARRLVQESLALLYADGGAHWVDEGAPLDPAGAPWSAWVAESNAREHFKGDVITLRFGFLVGPDSDLSVADVMAARGGVAPFPGPSDAYVPTVWLDDAGAAVAAAALRAQPGAFNVVDTDPPTRAEVNDALAQVVGRIALTPREHRHGDPLARSLRVSNLHLRWQTGWSPKVHGGTEGWRLIPAAERAA
jgi:nucleoside-diphosphate-sugar epimerase